MITKKRTWGTKRMDPGLQYYIWSFEHDGWWKPDRHGYTSRLEQAGMFSYVEALGIVQNANVGPDLYEAIIPAKGVLTA